MTLQLSAAEAVLKDDYGDEPRDFINNSVFIQSQIETNTDDITGRRALHAAHTRRSSGVGNRGDNGTLPTAGRQQYANTYIPVRYSYGRIQLTGPTIEAMGTERGSFVRAIDSEMNGMQNDVARDRNRQIWGTSNGVIAQCGTTSSSTRSLSSSTSFAVFCAISSTCALVWAGVPLASMPITFRSRPSAAKPTSIPAWVDPVTVQTMI